MTRNFDDSGYFITRGLLTSAQTEAIRGALMRKAGDVAASRDYGRDKILEAAAMAAPDAVPLHERFRKLNQLDLLPELWDHWYAGEPVLDIVRDLIGEDILRKYASAFLKPARVGGATPWHQDIALWRDRNDDAVNGWLAIDAATRLNGCLQFLPGSHVEPVVEHVEYEDSLHAELPRDLCVDLTVDHVELQPGDAVFWHSRLWHYSPPNESDRGRIGVGAVWVNPAQISQLTHVRSLRWAMRGGHILPHPAPELIISAA
ncbi:MAG: phytanoyl-CoA dioxygenase family protein [Candidatus Latescibacteria bacterium]|nr:phytanoyl-CoA dioxygenase family protein [Candidatus Latescibacterota bacterium]MDP7449961.1 phytanoyl-CoA dioxygenase family protein [Candidatus Latescibacterota bacterium]HJP31950.1 phytanoyl-CoA dioxygenase family protein [Candidatus Latescibacterota bacterium]